MNEAESQVRAALAAAPVILFVLDRHGVFTLCEGKALGLLALAPHEVVGRSVLDVHALPIIEAYRRALGGETFTATFDVDHLIFETRYTPTHDAQGQITGVLGVATNVTERKRFEAVLASVAVENARLVDALAQSNRFKADMVAIIAHELRTPLNAIMGYTDLLMEGEFGPLSSEQMEISRRVDRSAQVLRDLVVGTLELSRLDSGQLPLSLRTCDLMDLIRDIDTEIREQHTKSGVTLRWQTPTRLPQLFSDPLKIKVILKNLIANAVKFTQRGEILVSAAAWPTGIVLTVADTGIGIGAETLPHIFEPFRQGEQHASLHGGVGLGLYLVRRLTDVLGGTVEVESTRGRGSVFRVWLPLTHPTSHNAAAAPAPDRTAAGYAGYRTNHAA